MKTLVTLMTLTLVSISAFAKPVSVSAADKQRLMSEIKSDVMIKARLDYERRHGATCKAQLLSVNANMDFEASIDCHMPDGPDVGGGDTLITIKGGTFGQGKDMVLGPITIKIDYAG